MTSQDQPAHAVLDSPAISRVIFYPRAEGRRPGARTRDNDHLIAVTPDVQVGARFHMRAKDAVNLIFFHGNGEIVADYDELAPLFNHLGINFLPVDYRGYGRSGGRPTVGAMLTDSHIVLDYVRNWLVKDGFNGPLAVMGRSLGSACALELAAVHAGELDGLIIESGFAFAKPLLRLLGVAVDRIGFREDQGFGNIDKIRKFTGSTLIIHAQFDHIIPISDGQVLFDASAAQHKRFVQIDGANHNDLFSVGLETYLQALEEFVDSVRR
ncbi:MAG: alpha/beta fold hydrolase [Desulfobacteraceae bacterium]|nr:MAG: alpha/beta fold hydrolase [Desulfobacteraceae bacterium]